MSNLNNLLNEFDIVLRKHNYNNYKKLLSPLEEQDISIYLDKLDINDAQFNELFQWKNGFDIHNSINLRCQIFEYDFLLSIQSIIETTTSYRLMSVWENKFIPLLTDTTGQFILFNNEKGINYGKLYLYSVGLTFIEEPVSQYDSIYSLIETTIHAYEYGVFQYNDKQDWLDIDIKKFNELGKKFNNKSDYWNLES